METSKYQIIKDILLFLTIGIILYMLFLGNNNILNKSRNGNDTTTIYEKTTIIRDTVINNGYSTPSPKIYITNNISQDSLIALLTSFQSKNSNIVLDSNCRTINTYADTLQNDSSAFVVLYDTTQGQLLSRRKDIRIYGQTIFRDKVVEIKRPEWHLHVGAYGGYNTLSPTIIYTSKKRMEIGGGYDVIQNQPRIYMGYQIK